MKSKYLLRLISLLFLFVSLLPLKNASALVTQTLPPVDMFQLPWEQGKAWMAIDGIDNGSKRPASSSHNYKYGGAIDFAPHKNMITGEDTSNYWVTAVAAGTVTGLSSCDVTIDHGNGWTTQYQFLGNIKLKVGDTVSQNQRLGIIADGVRQKYCLGYQEINVPHLHFVLRPTIIGATFAGWEVKYSSLLNRTTFTKGSETLGLFQLLLNELVQPPTPTPTATATATATPLGYPFTPTPTLFGPYVSATVNPEIINVGESTLVTVSLNNVPAEGYTSAEFTCQFNPGSYEVSNITAANLFGPDPVVAINGPDSNKFIFAIAGSNGNKATTSGTVFTYSLKGLQPDQMYVGCDARVSTGTSTLTEIQSARAYLVVVGSTPTVNLTPSLTPTSTEPPVSLTPIVSVTPTIPGDWLTFTNSKYGFQFLYPAQGQILSGATDNYARINLPFVQGTNLTEKYLEVIVAENANPCQSPLATQSMLETSETVVINGITFLKQTGQDGTAGHINKWTAYSTLRDNVCVSLDFVLRAANPGVYTTPPPLYDEAAESAVFGQIVSTYTWLAEVPTTTATATQQTSTPVESPTPTFTATATATSVATTGALSGQVLASKPVTVSLYDGSSTLVTSVVANSDGTFSLTAAPGTYSVRATAAGFLNAEAAAALTAGSTITKPTVTLLAGDIDNNNVIDQLDAITIGMNYNAAVPAAADLNNDGVINVLDLELLAQNYRKTGPVAWQ
jgi:murein DD-endopeptidase MepM/ murein hydrolase activator NlpD